MDKMPFVTFIMPAYNAENFIGEAIASVQAQTVKDWELMIVDDGSTDDTMSVARRYAESDERITVLSMPNPSGSAYQPRKKAIQMSRSEFVSPLDADDWIEPTCLEQLLDKVAESGADLVYPTMFRGNKEVELLTPKDASLYDGVHEGKDCVRLTLDGWRINANGGLIKRKCYLDAYERFGSDISYSCADELLTRQLLFTAPKVAFSPAKYFYRPNPASITRKRSLKLFDFLINNRELLEFTKIHYGEGSEEYMLAQRQNFHGVFNALRLLNRFDFVHSDKDAAWRMIRESRKSVDVKLIRPHVSPRYMALMQAGLPVARLVLKASDPVEGGRGHALFGQGYDKAKKFLRDTIRIPARFSGIRDITEKRYLPKKIPLCLYDTDEYSFWKEHYRDGKSHVRKEGVVCMLDGSLAHGGVTDRIRGILTTWEEAKKRKIPFFINWTSPFRLEDYLEPAGYDWRIGAEDVSHLRGDAFPVMIEETDMYHSHFENNLRIRMALRGRLPQTHVYSNADNARGRYHMLYTELFRPSAALRKELDRHLAVLGERYYAFSFRFIGLLGDFVDYKDMGLPNAEADALVAKVTDEFRSLTSGIPSGARILVTSDSPRFLRHIASVDDRVYVVPGDVQHTDYAKDAGEDLWMKTFVDQHLLMHAERVTLMRTGRMHRSGFPRFAAEVGGVEFVEHKF